MHAYFEQILSQFSPFSTHVMKAVQSYARGMKIDTHEIWKLIFFTKILLICLYLLEKCS